ncbi:agamous-like MADS-box protein AGL23 [Hordeum vulgare subsp. vulgare]|uniref:MADS-box domain-containing protein n=1 Tax=Hordeum vulgare subsp. vulgare TaxID=112509 RepID=A0A8I7B650_HORVV|nr:agamous-like MADS-box protein AGL23 [Hordeum vulgare subsp. vulgare]
MVGRATTAPKRKGGNGRQKIAIRRIEKKDARQVCFAKRRQGLFNKAAMLAAMCGAQVAAVTFSPGGKAFSFGHPSAQAVIDRFLAGANALVVQGATDDNELKKLHLQHGELRTQLKEVKLRKQCVEEAMAKERAAGDQIAAWLDPELGDMGEEEMMAFAAELMTVRAAVSERANQVLLEVQNVSLFGGSTFELGSSSSANARMEMQQMQNVSLFGGSTYELGSSSSASARMEMQQMQMVIPSTQGFAAGMHMHMHQMLMTMPPPPGLSYGVDMLQMLMSSPPSPVFGIGVNMQQMVMTMQPQPEFAAETEMQPQPEFAAETEMQQVTMTMPPPLG